MNEIIEKKLATAGLGSKIKIPFKVKGRIYSNDIAWHIIDVRDLKDGEVEGCNEDSLYEEKIEKVISYLKKRRSVLICCKAGKSRSNAIAMGVLMKFYGKTYGASLTLVKNKARANIKNPHLKAIKRIC